MGANTGYSLKELLAEAWEIRRAFFPPQVEFVTPFRTLAVSSTGEKCALNCSHCGGYYLRGIATLEEALQHNKQKITSFLVSGGYNLQGGVPHFAQWEKIVKLSCRGALNMHTGLVTEEQARKLSQVADVVSFDFIVDNQTIEEVYGLSASGQDFIDSLQALCRYTKVVPHLCLGLKGGQMQGEFKALEKLKQEKVEAICFIVFRPTPGTLFESCAPPSLEEVGSFLAKARIMFPALPLYLGCMRPGGRYRNTLDQLALQAGINKIVQPVPAARRLAADLGLIAIKGEECCSL